MLNYRNFEQQIKDFDTEKEQFNLRIIELTEQTYEYESQIAKLKEELCIYFYRISLLLYGI